MSGSIKATLRKIKALADQGEGGEKTAAQAKLNELMDKYGITMEELIVEDTDWHSFVCETKTEQELLVQIICEVRQVNSVAWRGRKRNNKRYDSMMTAAEAKEIGWMYKHYRKELRLEQKRLFSAFVQRHSLFGPSTDDAPQMDPDEAMAIMKMARGLNSRTAQRANKQIEG